MRTVGRVLIATGLLLGGFVAYQLWGTGIEARRAQNELEDEFEALLASTTATTATTPTTPTTSDGLSSSSTPVDTVTETVPDTATTGVTQPVAPIVTAPIVAGDPVARLEIPAIGVDVVTVEGVSLDDLKRGPGHYPGTPLPGQFGNAAIAGHRTTYGQPFHDVDDLEPGDEIIVTTVAGRFVYEVTGTEIVEPDDTHVVATTNPDIAELTLTSCHPKWEASKRIIVHSVLNADESAPPGYADGAAPTTTTIAPTTTTIAPTTTIASTVTNTTDTVSANTTAPPTTSVGTSVGPTITTPSADAFSDGWFHDRSAIPQVLIWALVVTAIAVGAHLLGRRVHNKLIGIAAGVVPFLVTLYFFYQNVNRLLPPSL
jgi:sortase A